MNDSNSEQIVLEVDDSQVAKAVGRANAALDGYEKKAVLSNQNAGKSFESSGMLIIRTADRTRNSVERLVASQEKLAQTYGKTGVDRLVAQRDQLIQRLNGEEKAVERVRAAYEKMIAAEKSMSGGSSAGSGSAGGLGGTGFSVSHGIRGIKDVFEGRGTFAIAQLVNELMVMQGAALAIGATVTVVAGLGFAAYETRKKLEELAEAPHKTAVAFAELSASTRTHNDELRKQNDHITDTIAKLEHKPRNLLAEALDDARISADRLAESLSKDVQEMAKLVKENGVGMFERVLLGHKGTGDIEEWVKKYQSMIRDIAIAGNNNIHNATTKEDQDRERGIMDRALLAANRSGQGMVSRLIKETETPRALPSSVNDWRYSTGEAPTQFESREVAANRLSALKGLQENLLYQADNVKLMKDGSPRAAQEAEEARKVTEGLRQELAKAQEGELSGLQKINAAYKEKLLHLIDEGHYTKRNAKLITETSDQEYANILSKQSAKNFAAQIAAAEAGKSGVSYIPGTYLDPDFKYGESEQRAVQATLYSLTMRSLGRDGSGKLTGDTRDRMAAEAADTFKSTTASSKGDADRSIQAQERAVRLEENLIKLRTGPGGERQAIEETYQLRLRMAQQIFNIERQFMTDEQAGYKLAAQQDEARIARTEQLAQIQRRQFDEIKTASEGLFNTLFTNPSKFGGQLVSTIRSAVLKPITEGLGGMAARSLKGLIFGADGNGGIAGALHGIFGVGNRGINDVQLVNGAVPVVIMGAGSPSGGGGFSSASSTFARMFGGGGAAASIASAASGGEQIGWGSSQTGGLRQLSSGLWQRGPSGSDAATPPFVGDWGGGGGSPPAGMPGGGGGRGPGGILGNLKGSLSGLKGLFGFGNTSLDSNGDRWATVGNHSFDISGLGGKLTALATSPAAMIGGGLLASGGLLGSHRGTTAGIFMGAAGGALLGAGIGMQFGGPAGALIGAGIGAVAGFGIGLGEKIAGVETPEREAARLVKSIWGLNIDSNSTTIKQIVGIAKQNYGGTISIAVRSPQVRELLQLYADSTGQKSSALAALQVRSASLAESGGGLYQTASYQNGSPYTIASNLPTLGPSGSVVPSAAPGGGGPTYLSVNVAGDGLANFMTGRYVTPGFVGSQSLAASQQSSYRQRQAGALLGPSVITS